MAENVAKRVSAVGDAEMKGYLNTEKEMIYKKIIWELMNKEYLQPRIENKKSSAAAANTNDMKKKKKRVEKEMQEKKKKKQRLSSKINFDVLEKQEEEDKEGGRKVETDNDESLGYGHGDVGEERNEKSIGGEAEENYSEENEENDYGNPYYQEEEEDEEQGYNFDVDCDYEDY